MKKDNYVIFNPEGGLGKIIASTALIKYIHKKYPDHKIIVVTPWAEIYLNNPNIYRAYKNFSTPYFYKDYIEGRDSVVLKGEPYFQNGHIYQRNHLIQSWCDLFNLDYDGEEPKPELFFNQVEFDEYAKNFTSFDKPVLLFQTNGGPYEDERGYCWTRDFPLNQAQILTDELCKGYSVVQVAKKNAPRLQNATYIDDVPNKRTFIAMLARSQKRILIDSCLQHAAAAFNLPSTVCWVGTKPEVFGYKLHNNIVPNLPKLEHGTLGVDNQFFDSDFNGPEHEFPYETTDIFHLQDIFDSIVNEGN